LKKESAEVGLTHVPCHLRQNHVIIHSDYVNIKSCRSPKWESVSVTSKNSMITADKYKRVDTKSFWSVIINVKLSQWQDELDELKSE
jgi:nitroimidazol reductase NimA-like FMN-containing flavoprotein (pyridoxamine 5'-phosphate oxidase superfamily)